MSRPVGASLGAGEWLIGPAVTARYGGALLWITVLTLLAQYIYNVEASRYTLATGEGIMTGKLRLKPGSRFWTFSYFNRPICKIFYLSNIK
jgi:Mn2+/Fe2+ NRAMP family transporter